MLVFIRWISSKNPQKQQKNILQKNISLMHALVTKLLIFVKIIWKISLHWWFQTKLLTNLTSAWTSKVCFICMNIWSSPFKQCPNKGIFSMMASLSDNVLKCPLIKTAVDWITEWPKEVHVASFLGLARPHPTDLSHLGKHKQLIAC